MSKRERLEDLGCIKMMSRAILDNLGKWDELTNSKHDYSKFISYYSLESNLDDLFDELRFLKEKLEDIHNIACGDID